MAAPGPIEFLPISLKLEDDLVAVLVGIGMLGFCVQGLKVVDILIDLPSGYLAARLVSPWTFYTLMDLNMKRIGKAPN